MSDHNIYLDYAATTPVAEEVLESMIPYFSKNFGNPSSNHTPGKTALIAVDSARETIAKILNCRASEIYFTGSGSASTNLAILGYARANKEKGNHIITSTIEHSAVIQPCKKLEEEGFEVTYLPVNKEGFVLKQDLLDAITDQTILVSIQYVNNEIGTIEPIFQIGQLLKEKNITLHTDACQAAGYLSLNTQDIGCTMMSINASKIYGPKGIGVLFATRGTKIEPIVFGGNQEMGIRSGTHNVPGIVGMAKALELVQSHRYEEGERLSALRDMLLGGLTKTIPTSKLNGSITSRLPNNINICFPGIYAPDLVLQLDSQGIFCSTTSACSAKKTTPSHVLGAIGLSEKDIFSSVRLTLGQSTTKEDIEYTIETIGKVVEKLKV